MLLTKGNTQYEGWCRIVKKPIFIENKCSGCPSHIVYGCSRYCGGFKNKSRRKPFRKNEPEYKAPKWCPKRKTPCEYRIYGFVDENIEWLALSIERQSAVDYPTAFVSEYRYCLRASGLIGMSPREFYENANDLYCEKLFEQDDVNTGEVVEIDAGLSQCFFYCVSPHEFKVAHFNAERVATQEQK